MIAHNNIVSFKPRYKLRIHDTWSSIKNHSILSCIIMKVFSFRYFCINKALDEEQICLHDIYLHDIYITYTYMFTLYSYDDDDGCP